MNRINNNERNVAWSAFLEAANCVQEGAYNLELVRQANKFSTAPLETHERLVCLIGAASKIGRPEAVRQFGARLYNWSKENGYPSP